LTSSCQQQPPVGFPLAFFPWGKRGCTEGIPHQAEVNNSRGVRQKP
jgi:hypothetical protein